MTKSKIGPLMSRVSTDTNRVRANRNRGYDPHAKPPRITYANIRISVDGHTLRTKVSLDTEPVDSSLGNAILQAIAASGATAPVYVTLRLG